MSDSMELLLRTVAEVVFNKQHSFSTKNIFDLIDKKVYKENNSKITQFVLKEMFCENTGSHFLDSGGAYGRGYDSANAIKHLDWMEQKSAVAVVDQYSRDGSYNFYVSKNAYLFLCDKLEYDLEMDQRFHKWSNSQDTFRFVYYDKIKIPSIGNNKVKEQTISKQRIEKFKPKEENYYNCMTKWKDWLSQMDFFVNDYEDLNGYNTYSSGESCLNKTLQWEMFAIHSGEYEGHYIILQIHNGCDVRGGYSTPHVFKFDEDEFWCYLSDLTARCPNFGKIEAEIPGVQMNLDGKPSLDPNIDLKHVDCYSDDGGSHWYGNGGAGIEPETVKYTTDEGGEYHINCKKCGAELEFW